MSIITLDSHILVWGIKGEASPGQEPMVSHAKRFFKWIDEEKHDVLLTSLVLGELLMRVPPEKHAEVLKYYDSRFKVVNFDTLAASCFAGIWQKKNEDKTIEIAKNELQIGREEMKIDCQIVACAVSRKMDCIYTYDKGLAKFAEGFIATEKMPDLGTQQNLFDSSDSLPF